MLANGLGLLGVSRPGAAVVRAHEAGALHAEGSSGPSWLRPPQDVNALVRPLWAAHVDRRDDGALSVAGVDVRELARQFGTPAYVLDEDDFRGRARGFKQAFDEAFADLCGGADVYYAGKAFLCTAVARWVREEGLCLDVCSGGELAVAIRAGFPGERIALHGNNKSTAEIEAALAHGVGRIVVDSFEEIDRIAAVAARLGVVAPVMVRVTVGVEAHTHEYIATAHEDQKFGFSLAGGQAAEAVRQILKRPGQMSLRGLHSHIGSQIFDVSGFEVAARRVLDLRLQVAREHGVELPELDLGGGFGIAYTTQHDPLPPRRPGRRHGRDHRARLPRRRRQRAAHLDRARVARSPGRAPSRSTRWAPSRRSCSTANASRTYVAVDGGMSDNIRPALYDADYSCTVANRVERAAAGARPASSASTARAATSSSRTSSCRRTSPPATCSPSPAPAPTAGACPASTTTSRARRSSPSGTGVARVIVRRETIEDLLGLDVD